MRLGSDHDVALILGISHERLKARISAGAAMPPHMRTPGSKYRRWDLDQVEAWLARYTVGSPDLAGCHDKPNQSPDQQQAGRGRGRPRKVKTDPSKRA